MGYTAGVVISASHNPFEDNGIKVFSGAGEKFTEALERQVESIIADTSWTRAGGDAAPVEQVDYRSEYLGHLREILPPDAPHARHAHRDRLRQRRDDDGGAAAVRASSASRCVASAVEPDGRNINLRLRLDRAGAAGADWSSRAATRWASPSTATATARSSSTRTGQIVDGDAVMLMCAKQMKAEGRLKGNAIVATVMSNIGLEIALREAGIGIVRCAVGDKYVMEEMLRRGLVARRRAVRPRHLLGLPVHR